MEKLKVMVVDDESRIRKLVRDFLVRQDFDVIEAGDGEQAVDLFFEEKDIALIILDVMMPKMDGWQDRRDDRTKTEIFCRSIEIRSSRLFIDLLLFCVFPDNKRSCQFFLKLVE